MGEIYVTNEYWFAAFQLVFAMLGMGATLTVSDFKEIIKAPKAVTIGTAAQLILVPVVAFLFIQAFGIIGGVAIGLALVASIPGGTTSNIFTYFAKGNIPLSISVTAITTLSCLITTPIVLGLLITQYLPTDFTMPTSQIVREITFTLLLPLAMGMVFLKYAPNKAEGFSKWCIRLSLIGIVAIVIGSSAAGRLNMEAFGQQNLVLVLFFIAAIALMGWGAAKLLSLNQADSTAIEMEIIVRNVNLAILIKASMFPAHVNTGNNVGDMVLFTALIYGALQMLVAALLIFYRRKTGK